MGVLLCSWSWVFACEDKPGGLKTPLLMWFRWKSLKEKNIKYRCKKIIEEATTSLYDTVRTWTFKIMQRRRLKLTKKLNKHYYDFETDDPVFVSWSCSGFMVNSHVLISYSCPGFILLSWFLSHSCLGIMILSWFHNSVRVSWYCPGFIILSWFLTWQGGGV